ncbi:MAG: SDR family NAD(P)-dependent oxidoreductase [Gemmatimonadales bacterium]
MGADFRDKVALVTGVGRVGQIGHAVARALGTAGARLVIADVNAAAVAERVREFQGDGLEVRGVSGNLTRPEDAQSAVATARREFGGLDVVVNVAGGLVSYGPFLKSDLGALEQELAINVQTTFNVCREAIPLLIDRGGGAIVNFSSIAVVKPATQMAAYTAAKAAVAGLTRALAREFRAQGVRVNAVAPVAVRTKDNLAQMPAAEQAKLIELDDLVHAVLFLASDDAKAVSGEVLPVTGRSA